MRGEALSYHVNIPNSVLKTQPLRENRVARERMQYLPSCCLFDIYRIVICLTMSALAEAPEPLMLPAAPAFFSKIFQNFKLSSAAAVMID